MYAAWPEMHFRCMVTSAQQEWMRYEGHEGGAERGRVCLCLGATRRRFVEALPSRLAGWWKISLEQVVNVEFAFAWLIVRSTTVRSQL